MIFWVFCYYVPFQCYPVTRFRAFSLLPTDALDYWLLSNARLTWKSRAVNLNLIQNFASIF